MRNFFLIKRDVDYYIVGYHGPKVRESSNFLFKFFSVFIWFYSGTIVPIFDEINSEYRFILYDKYLNKITEQSGYLNIRTLTNWYFLKNDLKKNGVSIKDHLVYVELYKNILDYTLSKDMK